MEEEGEGEESRQNEGSTGPVCSVIKPEPRAATFDEPPEESDLPCRQLDLSESTPPAASDLNRKSLRKTRWTSSPPSRKNSVEAGQEVCGPPDEGATAKPSTSPFKRTSKTTAFKKPAHSFILYDDNLKRLYVISAFSNDQKRKSLPECRNSLGDESFSSQTHNMRHDIAQNSSFFDK